MKQSRDRSLRWKWTNTIREKSRLLRTGEWEREIIYKWKNELSNEGVNKRIGIMELEKHFLQGIAVKNFILIQGNMVMFSFPFFQPSNKINHCAF